MNRREQKRRAAQARKAHRARVTEAGERFSPLSQPRPLDLYPAPPDFVGFFTRKQHLVLRAMVADLKEFGECRRTTAQLADKAMCSETTVRSTIAEATRRGLLLPGSRLCAAPPWLAYLQASKQEREALWDKEHAAVMAEGEQAWQEQQARAG